MKLIMLLSAVLLLFTASAFSELTVADLENIRSIVEKEVNESEKRLKEEIASVKAEVAASEKRLKEDIVESEQHLKEDISQEIAKVYVKIEEMGKSMNYIFMMVIALVALIAVVVGIPQIVVARQQKDMRAQDEKFEAQQKQIEALQRELETFK